MIYYNPSIENAYNTVKDIKYVVFAGNLMRNIHKWAGEGMIIFVMLHMARVLYTGAYKKGKEFNWVVGIMLLILTFVLNLSGYMLPWDQLSYWALVIVSNIIQSPKELTDILGITGYFDVGGFLKELLLGGTTPGKETLIRVYFLHIMLLPIILFIFLGVHFWRIRKDGGLTRPQLLEKTSVLTWPHLLRAETAVFMLCLAGVVMYSFHIDAPLKELANSLFPENPAKAPWYFLGLQEMVSYSAFMGGIIAPGLAVLGLALIPYLDREQDHIGIWFSDRQGKIIALQSFVAGSAVLIGILVFTVKLGWFRNWWPDVPQLLIILINPSSIWVGFMTLWSIWMTQRTGSTRMGAIALFTMFFLSYVIFTYVGTELRGPNWEFYWSESQWPMH
jgi:quinol-cytochrome oxidoreductase complex cytochrome b subunit